VVQYTWTDEKSELSTIAMQPQLTNNRRAWLLRRAEHPLLLVIITYCVRKYCFKGVKIGE
jgi:hypothetical protein